MDQTQRSKPHLGVKPYWMVAWSRISDLVEAIERQYEDANGNAELVELWAREIVLQCQILNRLKGQNDDTDTTDSTVHD